MKKDVVDQLLVELIAGYECTALQRRSGIKRGRAAPATYPLDFLHILPDSVQQQYRDNAALVLARAYELGPLDEVADDIAMNATYDDWLLAEARVALGTMGQIAEAGAKLRLPSPRYGDKELGMVSAAIETRRQLSPRADSISLARAALGALVTEGRAS